MEEFAERLARILSNIAFYAGSRQESLLEALRHDNFRIIQSECSLAGFEQCPGSHVESLFLALYDELRNLEYEIRTKGFKPDDILDQDGVRPQMGV